MIGTAWLAGLNSHSDLLLTWTMRIVRARYQQSVLGGAWAVAQPAATVLIFALIFTRIVPVDTSGVPYIVFSFVAMVPWTLFSSAVSDMVTSLVDNMSLISKIYFRREILPVAALMARFLDFGISALVLVLVMAYYQIPVFLDGLIYLPAIVAVQILLILGLGLGFSAINLFYRDVKHLVELILRLMLYVSPVIYPVSLVPENLRPLYFLNPMAGVITSYRDVLIYGTVPGGYLAVSAIISAVLALAGFGLFKSLEPRFADLG